MDNAKLYEIAREVNRVTNGYGSADLMCIVDAVAAAVRSESVPVIPEGMALVPVEPTEAMIDAGCKEHECVQEDRWYSNHEISEYDAKSIYSAMVATAQVQP